ncbi:site-specific DNA-methyltransferase [Kytococcus sedentarius]|uniref:site-specific DNA-methyltransferase n=1 Tax=Kytococcus sedentarius TaxID=1276 RepID=UPI00195193AA|nr:site-specific DNA-methyltransferase [Kytococcus sedentarius]QRO87192.1 site-specific DNA-methyltransferase [Kytococcus sedentarius]
MTTTRLELTWANKDKALIPTEHGRYDYAWVDPRDPRYCEVRPLVLGETVMSEQAPKDPEGTYTDRADLEPQQDNLLIHGESGDVLEALTHVPELAEKYVGRIKCVYIDPPFNTGETFTHYEDNLENSIWLTLMRDRLLHLRRLLSDDGSIWVHLDDAQVHRMRVLMDEVFGPGNFVAEVVWQKAYSPRNDAPAFSVDQDVILVYSKQPGWRSNRFARLASRDALYRSTDGDPRPWISADPAAPSAHRNQLWVYAIQNPITGDLIYPAKGRCWGQNQDAMHQALEEWGVPYRREVIDDAPRRAQIAGVTASEVREGVPALLVDLPLEEAAGRAMKRHEAGTWPEIYFTKGGRGGIKRKRYLDAVSASRAPQTLWTHDEVGHNRSAKHEINLLFPEHHAFATPKPERLLERVIHIATNPGDIVLDVFAGSGTTAAVAQKMGRRWVTCELLGDTVEQFTRPRLEKVVRGEDPGGITTVAGEREAAEDVTLPEGMDAASAQTFTSLLNKVVKDDPDGLKNHPVVKQLKALTKTVKTKDAVNWRGGGGFRMATLAPQVFDYDPDLQLVTLTEDATGETLIASVAANLGFHLTPEHPVFHGVKNSMRLVVVEGTLTHEAALDLVSHLSTDEGLTIAALGREEGVLEAVRRLSKGVRVLHVPDDLFRQIGANDQEATA